MKPQALAALLGVLLLSVVRARADEPARASAFPDSHHLFPRLLADPRQAQTSARYYRLNGRDTADVALGNTWGMHRWRTGRDGDWQVQWNIEGMGYSRFLLSGAVNEFQTIDFFANVPVEVRHGRTAARFTVFHESSHLGDDYIRRTGDAGSRFSVEGVRALASFEPSALVRLYGGGSEHLHTIPSSLGRATLQAGFELTTPDLRWLPHPCWLYLAEDVKSKQDVRWNVNSKTELGFRIGFPGGLRSMRVHLGYFTGHSEFAQFLARRESFFDTGASFDF